MITNLNINNIEVSGRLGNNLFQIAMLVGLKEKYGYNYFIPEWRHCRDFSNVICNPNITLKPLKRYVEPKFTYSEIPFDKDLEGEIQDFKGYFQSERYFKHCRKAILDTFQFSTQVVFKANMFLRDLFLDPKETVVVHIRRGDYLLKQDFHTNLFDTSTYYMEAMKVFRKEGKKFLIFSDDIGFCKRVFYGLDNIYYSDSSNEVEDLCIMSLCSNFVIANSSFSWWGAYLSQSTNKSIIAPRRWFETNIDTTDLIPKDWIVI